MVEIEQEELDSLRQRAGLYDELSAQHEELKNAHNTLKDDYIALCKGKQATEQQQVDDFDRLCAERFKK